MSLAESAVGEGADGAAQAEPALTQGREIFGGDFIVSHHVRQHQVKNRPSGVHDAAGQAHNCDGARIRAVLYFDSGRPLLRNKRA